MPEAIPVHPSSPNPVRLSPLVSITVFDLLTVLGIMLFASVRQESGLADETMHLFAGYEYWKHADFGRNPEHPPFAKMLAALPLLPMHLQEPPQLPIPLFKGEDGAYANELFGGPSHIYRLAADSNSDRGQGLKWTKRYLDQNPTTECWVSHESAPVVPPEYYGIRCKPLLNGFSRMIGTPVAGIPRTISGTIFIGATDIIGFLWGPGSLNPYAAFRDGHPDAVLDNDIWVYHGTYDVSLLSALNGAVVAQSMLRRGQPAAAVALAKAAAEEYSQSADSQATLGQSLLASGHVAEGQQALAEAIRLARADQTGYQRPLLDQIEHPAQHP